MEFNEWEEPKSCPCYQKNIKWEFTRIFGNEDAGIEVYQHRPQTDDLNKELLSPMANSTDGNGYIVHNTCAMPVYPDDFLPTFDTCKIECPRCKKNVLHAQRFLRKVPIIDEVYKGICDHCVNQTKQTCNECEKMIKKFITTKDRQEVPHKKIKTWVSNIKEAFKELINSRSPMHYKKYTISEPDLAQARSRAYRVRSAQSYSKSKRLRELQEVNKLYGMHEKTKDAKNLSSRDLRQVNTEIFNDDGTNEIDENIAKEFNKYNSDKKIHEMEKKSHSPDFNIVDDIAETNEQNYNVGRQHIPTESIGSFDDDDSYAARKRIQKYKHDDNEYYYEKYDVPIDKNVMDMKYSQKERNRFLHNIDKEIFSDDDALHDIYQKRKHRVKKYERIFGYEGKKEYNDRHYYEKPRYQPTKKRFDASEIDINEILNDQVRGEFRNLNLFDYDRYIKNRKRKKTNDLRRSISDTLLNMKDYTIPQETKITLPKIQVKSIISDTLVPATIVSQIKSNYKIKEIQNSLELSENKYMSDQDKFYKALAKLIEASMLSDHPMSKRAKHERGKLGVRKQKAKTPALHKIKSTELKSGECLHREFGKIFITEDSGKDFQYLFLKKRFLTEEVQQDNSADLIAKTMEMENRRVQEKQRKQKVKEEKEKLRQEKQILKEEKMFEEEMKKKFVTDQRHQGKKDIATEKQKDKDDDIINKKFQIVVDGGEQLADKDYIEEGKQERAENQITEEEYNENDERKHTEEQLARNGKRKRGKKHKIRSEGKKKYATNKRKERVENQITEEEYNENDEHTEKQLARNYNRKRGQKHKIKSDGKIKYAINKKKRFSREKDNIPSKKKKIKLDHKLDHSMRTNTGKYEGTKEMQLGKKKKLSEKNKQEMEIIEKSLEHPQKARQSELQLIRATQMSEENKQEMEIIEKLLLDQQKDSQSKENKQEMEIIEKLLQDQQKNGQLYKDFEGDSKVVEPAREEQNYKIPDGDELQLEINDKKTEQDTSTDDQLIKKPKKRNDGKNDQLVSKISPQTQKADKNNKLLTEKSLQKQEELITKKFPQTQRVDDNNLLARKSLEKQNDYENLTRMSQQAQEDDKNDQLLEKITQKDNLLPKTQGDDKGVKEEKSLILKQKDGNLINMEAVERKKSKGSFSAKKDDKNDQLLEKMSQKDKLLPKTQGDDKGVKEEKSLILKQKDGNLINMEAVERKKSKGSLSAKKDDNNDQLLEKMSQKDKLLPKTQGDDIGVKEEKSLILKQKDGNLINMEAVERKKSKGSFSAKKDDKNDQLLEKMSQKDNLLPETQGDDKGVKEEKSLILKQKDGNLINMDAVQRKKSKGSFSAKVITQKKISRLDPLGANVTSMLEKEHLASDLPKDSSVSPVNRNEPEKPSLSTKIPTIFKEIDIKKLRLIKTHDAKLKASVKSNKKGGLTTRKTPNEPKRGMRFNSIIQKDRCSWCQSSNESDSDNLVQTKIHESADEIIIIDKIHKHKNIPLIEKKDNVPFEFTKTAFSENFDDKKDNLPFEFTKTALSENIADKKQEETTTISDKRQQESGGPKGFMRYALSDRTFIDKGWTILPTVEVVRKANVYRMRPSHPEFDWFFLNKDKGLLTYDTGEKLAEIDEKGRGRWFYKNGRVALEYYDCEELNAKQRVVVYGNGKPDVSGRWRPATILATFDYLGNAVVLDHTGKIRLKYNQNEGVMLDRSLGPVTTWKWHSLNDPPELLQVMVETKLRFKDRDILNLSEQTEQKQKPVKQEVVDKEVENEVVAIEQKKLIKKQSKKLKQKYEPYQIRMKALKINDCFSLSVIDQATVHLFFRDGKTNMRLNLGMLLDNKEIIDTDVAEVGIMTGEFPPAKTDSMEAVKRNVERARQFEQARIDREKRIRPTLPQASADNLIAAVTRPQYYSSTSVDCGNNVDYSCRYKYRKPSCCSVYYNTRIV